MLVVDDDPNVGKSLKLLLEGLGHDVVFERDPQAALERFKVSTRSFDLVLTNLTMPKLDGIEFAQELTRLGHVSPIVLVSGRNAFLKPEALTGAKIAAVLPKPFTLNELEGTVARLLPRPDARIARRSRPWRLSDATGALRVVGTDDTMREEHRAQRRRARRSGRDETRQCTGRASRACRPTHERRHRRRTRPAISAVTSTTRTRRGTTDDLWRSACARPQKSLGTGAGRSSRTS